MNKKFINPNKEEYNNEEVYYCANCLSLKIYNYDEDKEIPKEFDHCDCGYCGMCTSTNIKKTHIYN